MLNSYACLETFPPRTRKHVLISCGFLASSCLLTGLVSFATQDIRWLYPVFFISALSSVIYLACQYKPQRACSSQEPRQLHAVPGRKTSEGEPIALTV